MIKFKILDTATGLYSHGGYWPVFGDRGKSWDSKKSIISHLRLYKGQEKCGRTIPDSWQVVEFQVVLNEIGRESAIEILGPEEPVVKAIVKKPKKKDKNKRKDKRKFDGK
jgi:hypothetical protein